MTTHLRDEDVEALAHGREELASDQARAHVRACDDCRGRVTLARADSRALAGALHAATPTVDDEELAALVSGAIARAGHELARPPSRRAVLVAATLGTAVLATSAALSFRGVPTTYGVLGALRDGLHASLAVDEIVRALLPGGWGTLALACALIALLTTWPLVRLARGLAAVPGRAVMLGASALALVATLAPSSHARAVDFTGEWPAGERVTLTASHAHLSQVLSRAAEGAGLGYVGTLADDPEVTVSVRGEPLRDFLAALLGDAPLLVDHEPGMLVVRPALPAPSAPPLPSAPPSPPPPPPSPPSPPSPPPLPVAPVEEAEAHDRFTFGGDVVVREGERVRSVVSMGGDVEIRGEVLGDVTSMGGDVHVLRGGAVHGEIVSMGGEIRVDDGANVPRDGVRAELSGRHRPYVRDLPPVPHRLEPPSVAARVLEQLGETASDVTGHLARYALLFLVGLLLLSLAPRRFGEVTRTLRAEPLRALAVGALAAIAGTALFVVLIVSIVGIPGALAVAIGAALAGYAGLAAVACVLGAALPLRPLAEKPIAQLAVGAGVLFVVSLVPFFGGLALFAAVLAGAGAVVLTRGGKKRAIAASPPSDPPPPPDEHADAAP